jgi:hypothetical protein
MIKKIMLIVMMFCSVLLGDYDNTAKEIMAGGYGFGTGAWGSGDVATMADAKFPCLVSGKIKTVRLRCWSNTTAPVASPMKFKVLRGSSSPFTIVSDTDISAQVNAVKISGAFTVTIDMSAYNLNIAVGDFVGIYLPATVYIMQYGTGVTDGLIYHNQSVATDQTGATATLAQSMTDRYFMIDYTVTTSDADSFEPFIGTTYTKDSIVRLPYYANKNQYIVFEGIDGLAEGESVNIALQWISATGAPATLDNIIMTLAAGSEAISITTGTKSALIGAVAGHKFDIALNIDNTNQKIEVLYMDREGAVTKVWKSLTARVPQTLTNCKYISKITFTQAAGADVTIDKVIVCHMPIVAVGDSFVDTGASPCVLGSIGAASGEGFTNKRYVFNGGRSGSRMVDDNTETSTSVTSRWNSIISVDNVNSGDMCAFRDVIVVPVCGGGGLNDIASFVNTALTYQNYLPRVSAGQIKIAGEALSSFTTHGGTNDLVLCEMIPYTRISSGLANQYNAAVITSCNKIMRRFAEDCNIPMAIVHDGFDVGTGTESGRGWYNDDGTHPDADGIAYIVGEIVSAYENNTIPYYTELSPSVVKKDTLYGDANSLTGTYKGWMDFFYGNRGRY